MILTLKKEYSKYLYFFQLFMIINMANNTHTQSGQKRLRKNIKVVTGQWDSVFFFLKEFPKF